MDNYLEAAKVLRNVRAKKGSLRTLALNPHVKNKKFVYACVSETLKREAALDAILKKADLKTVLSKQIRDPCMLTVLLYDLLFGKGIQGGGSIKRILKTHEAALKEAAKEVLKHEPQPQQPVGEEDGTGGCPIRYVRVNTLKLTVAEAIEGLTGGSKKAGGKPTNASNAGFVYLKEDVQQDPHIKGLLVLPGGRSMHDHPMVRDGGLVLQDKASCFPAHALLGPGAGYHGGDVIDACAAPGNKTAQVAASLAKIDPKGRVFAFDRDPKRLGVLKSRVVVQMGGSNVVPLLQDFLAVDPQDDTYSKVKAILLDPSCSGSGMDSLERRVEGEQRHHDKKMRQRLLSLSQFQYKALIKAFSFPQVERVVYSTCSVHVEENEMVVSAVLRGEQEKLAADPAYRPFQLKPTLQTWPRRGLGKGEEGQTVELTEEQLSCLVRADAKADRTNGFFVAYFERSNGEGDSTPKPSKQVAAADSAGKANGKRKRKEEEEAAGRQQGKQKGEKTGKPKQKGKDAGKPQDKPPSAVKPEGKGTKTDEEMQVDAVEGGVQEEGHKLSAAAARRARRKRQRLNQPAGETSQD